ncbi:MAG: CPXCG motif-containing cysteine-rich protein [Gammaproteobacteria bacterium]
MPGNLIETVVIHCPYCGEAFDIVVDCSAGDQRYVEDCQVCCQPMELAVTLDETGLPAVAVAREDEA